MRAATDSMVPFEGTTAPPPMACPRCGQGVDPHSQHVTIADSGVRVFCSEHCMVDRSTPVVDIGVSRPRRLIARVARFCGNVFLIGAGLASLSPGRSSVNTLQIAWAARTALPSIAPRDAEPANDPLYGPAPPTEQDEALQFALALGNDKWVHPLPGPERRMPNRDSRVFGADRPGDRPHECRSGHCGVDIGGEVWGEHVYAVHDGTIERVERRPKPNGGKYVRIAHRDGTVISQYFHLAAIPRRLEAGSVVKAGDIVGVVGETGVERSGPHLHFSVSIRPEGSGHEIYIDPEPLIALWPLKVVERGVGARTVLHPGVPRGATGRKGPRRSTRSRVKPSVEPLVVSPEGETEPTPASDSEPKPKPAPSGDAVTAAPAEQ